MSGFFRGFPIQGDLELTDDGRDLVFVSGAQQVIQSIKARAQIYKGSWRYDLTKGVPYFQEILVGGPEVELVRRRFYDLIAETPGVVTVKSLVIRLDGASQTVFVDFAAVITDGSVATGSLDFVTAT